MKGTRKKRLYSFILVFSMICNLFFGLPISVAAEDSTSGDTDIIEISTAQDFIVICNETDFSTISDKKIVLTADIDMTGVTISPIGGTAAFNGIFDGQGHVIKNLTISAGDTTGLFGYVGQSGQIMNLGLESVTVSGSANTGAIAGCLAGSVTECYVTGSITGKVYTGGIAGLLHAGTIQNCWVDVQVQGTACVGGLFGGTRTDKSAVCPIYNQQLDGSNVIENNLILGTVSASNTAGGMLGDMSGNANYSCGLQSMDGNMIAVDSVTTTNGGYGHIYGYWSSARDIDDTETYANYYWDGMTISGTGDANDPAYRGNFSTMTEAQINVSDTYSSIGWDFENVWSWSDELGHPVLQVMALTEADVLEIGTAEELLALFDESNYPNICDKTIVLTADIDMSGQTVSPIGGTDAEGNLIAFNGIFDGQGHMISNLTISGDGDCTGFFAYVGTEGQIMNVGLHQISVTGGTITGVFAGCMTGSVSNSYATGSVSAGNYTGSAAGLFHAGMIQNCWFDVEVTGGDGTGGLFGETEYTATGSPLTARITDKLSVVENVLVLGSVSGETFVGGMLGNLSGASKGCEWEKLDHNVIWIDSVTSSENYFSQTYGYWSAARKTVGTGNVYWDGISLVGDGTKNDPENSSPSGTPFAISFSSKTVDELGVQTTYEEMGWDFENVWIWSENLGHPILRGITTPGQEIVLEIGTVEELLELCAMDFAEISDKKIVLTADIDMSGKVIAPIGGTSAFNGIFDGQGYAIKNLTITGSEDCTGLFGYVGTEGQILRLGLENVTVIGGYNTGAIAGCLTGSVSQCYVTGNVSGTAYVGGIAGMLHAGTIQNCWVDANVTASSSYAGVLFGGCDYDTRGNTAIVPARIADKSMVVENNLVLGTAFAKNYVGAMLGDMGGGDTSNLKTFDGNVAWTSTNTITGKNGLGYVHGWWSTARGEMDTPDKNVYWEGISLVGTGTPVLPDSRLNFVTKTAEELGTQTLYETELGWDFENIWIWSEELGHPVLKGMSVPEEPGSQKTPVSLITTYAGDPKTTRAFSWYTDTSVSETVVQLVPAEYYTGVSDFDGENVITASGTSYELQITADTLNEDGTVDKQGEVRNIHQIQVTGLTAGTTYYYRAGDGVSNWSVVYTITTEAEDSDSFTFFSMTDTQARYDNYASVLADATSRYPESEFILHGGDVIQNNATADYDTVYKLTQEYVATLPSMITAGNHELAKDVTNGSFEPDYVKGIDNFKSHYLFPDNGPENSKQVVYSFEYGDAYFAILNSNTSGYDNYQAQIEWLKQDIANTDKAWKIVSIHVGPYNYYGKGSSAMINAMDDLGIDLVLFGHNHTFLRSNPIKDGVVGESELRDGIYYAASDGTVYYSAGCSGANAGSINENPSDGSAPVGGIDYFAVHSTPVSSPTYGVITVTEETLTITSRAALNNPQIIDTLVICKEAEYTAPIGQDNLVYNGEAQELITAGSTEDGQMLYSLDGENYSAEIPVATDAATYTVWYKVEGDETHRDTEAQSITVTVAPKDIAGATITLGTLLTYTGTEQTQSVESVEIEGLTVTYEVSGNTGTEAGDGYVLTVTGTGNYTGTATKSWSIAKADVTHTAPVAQENLVYSEKPQELIAAGSAEGGSLLYSLDGENYSAEIPTATDAGEYTVWYKVEGDGNHNSVVAQSITVTIAPKDIADAVITLGEALTYTGSEQTQTVANVELEGMTVTYEVSGNTGTEAGDGYVLTVTGTGNYIGTATKSWSIAKADVTYIAPVTQENLVYSENPQELIVAGSAENGDLLYSLDGENYSAEIPTATDAGEYTVWYKVEGDGNHNSVEAQSITVTIAPKDIADAVITLGETLTYTGSEQTQTVEDVELEGMTVTYEVSGNTGTEAGDGYILTITGTGNYAGTATAEWSIAKADVTYTAPVAKENLIYNEQEQELITVGSTEDGEMVYSLDGENYSTEIPVATEADTYTVWYKVEGDENHNDTDAQNITVVIAPKTNVDDPVNPDEPVNPDDPAKPDDPSKPDDPVKPDDPAKPDNPTNPDEPAKPESPEKPENTTKNPNTGDDSKVVLWGTIAIVAFVVGLVQMKLYWKKQGRELR